MPFLSPSSCGGVCISKSPVTKAGSGAPPDPLSCGQLGGSSTLSSGANQSSSWLKPLGGLTPRSYVEGLWTRRSTLHAIDDCARQCIQRMIPLSLVRVVVGLGMVQV